MDREAREVMADRPKLAQGAQRQIALSRLLGVSFLLHLALLWLVPMPPHRSADASLAPRLQVRLGSLERPVVLREPRLGTTDVVQSPGAAMGPRSEVTPVPRLAPLIRLDPPAPSQGVAPDTAALMDSARRMARAESIQLDRFKGKYPVPEVGKPSPEAAVAAMAAHSRILPEETRLADGTLRVVNQWGVRYCTKAPTDFQRSGPVGNDAVVTNCL